MHFSRFHALSAVFFLGLCLAGLARADELFSPLLTLRMGERVIELEREQLAALPQTELRTSTTLSEGAPLWRGVLLRDLLHSQLGLSREQHLPLRIESWDDYQVDFTSEDFDRWDVLLAWQVDGKEMGVLEMGPLRVIYPRDQHAELQDSRFDHRWVWLLRQITVNP